jgi:phytoene/squalene synthetase
MTNDHLAQLEMLCRELDEELDGVQLPRSAAAILNAIRVILDDIDEE